MADDRLELIRQYCDTTGVRLNDEEKDILCKILEDPSYYDGYETDVYEERDSGRTYNDTWNSITRHQYRICIDDELSIYERYFHSADGYDQDAHWDWDNAWHITKIRDILEILFEIEDDL